MNAPQCVSFFVNIQTGNLWEDAELVQCLNYVLASRRLVVPEEYQPVFHYIICFRASELPERD